MTTTGIATLDAALGDGLPQGRIVEISGPEISVVGALALTIAATAQRAGSVVAAIDTRTALTPEHAARAAFWPERALRAGVRLDELLVSQPQNIDQAFEIIEVLARSGAVGLILVDLGTPAPQPEDAYDGLIARLVSQRVRKLTTIASKTNVTIVFLTARGTPSSGSYGNALKFYSSVRLEVRGHPHAVVRVLKNKFAPPFEQAEVVLA